MSGLDCSSFVLLTNNNKKFCGGEKQLFGAVCCNVGIVFDLLHLVCVLCRTVSKTVVLLCGVSGSIGVEETSKKLIENNW